MVRNGRGKPRQVTLGSGTVTLEAPRVNDKREVDGQRQTFTNAILLPYLRRSQNISDLLPILYLRGLSTGDFREALPTLLGDDASGLSPSAITRLVAAWTEERSAWKKRSLADRDYVYVWAERRALQRSPRRRSRSGTRDHGRSPRRDEGNHRD